MEEEEKVVGQVPLRELKPDVMFMTMNTVTATAEDGSELQLSSCLPGCSVEILVKLPDGTRKSYMIHVRDMADVALSVAKGEE